MEYNESSKVVITGIFKEETKEHNFPDNSPFNPDPNSYIGDLNNQNYSRSKIKLIRDMEKFIIDGLRKGDTIGNIGYKSNVINTGNKSSAFAEKSGSVTINSGDRSLSST